MSTHAVFAVAPLGEARFAATTRASDRDEAGRIGFPGGKVDPGETPVEAAIREAAEEGWDLTIAANARPFHRVVDGDLVIEWFVAANPVMRADFKERGRISPIEASFEQMMTSGYYNDEALRAYQKLNGVAS